ncbi:hypothetical protein BXZ70DRAFT_916675 [Cristinia sonorae]|uniref:Uncharacterized protein n=1 Tax=Cristinia sonorae TaxID=1940300 RepID=A0A8K0UXK2_9AGAR|nr:hypothetical protein BXZ70DRAFT_916675 [Cristinia sonorae]
MGGAPSKAARQFPKHNKPSWAGARTPSANPEAPSRSNPSRASETKTIDIERDAKDPHLAANLTRLGPVRVDHHIGATTPVVNEVTRTFQSRLQSEQQASSSHSTRNRLVASALMDLLDAKKNFTFPDSRSFQGLADEFNVDLAKLVTVAQYLNSPSVDPESYSRVVKDDGTERTTMRALWVDRNPK